MKKNYVILSFLLVALNVNSQSGNPVFMGSCADDMLREMVVHDHYIYGVGTTQGFEALSEEIYLFKADTSGQHVWARMISTGDAIDQGVSLHINNANQIIVTSSIPHENGSVMISVFDTSGNPLQSKVINNTGCSIIKTCSKSDNGSLFCGFQVDTGHYYPVIISTDPAGDILWAKVLNGDISLDSASGNGIATSVLQQATGNIMVAGTVLADTTLPFVAQLDPNGNILWYRVYNRECMSNIRLIETIDGNYMLCGGTVRDGVPGSDPFIMKIDPSGNILFSYVYAFDPSVSQLTALSRMQLMENDNDFIITGTVANDMLGEASDFYAMRLDPAGNMVWAKKYGNSTLNICNSMLKSGNNLVMGGYSSENADGNAVAGIIQNDILLVKTNQAGVSPVNNTDLVLINSSFINGTVSHDLFSTGFIYAPTAFSPTITTVSTVNDSANCYGLTSVASIGNLQEYMNVYPNPATVYTEITFDVPLNSFDVYIHNTAGEMVYSKANINNGTLVVNVNDLSPGVYVVTARSGQEYIGSKKLIVQ